MRADPASHLPLERADDEAGSGWRSAQWVYPSTGGDHVHAEVTSPSDMASWAVVIAAHGILGSGQAPYLRGAARGWARHGLITVAPDAPLHGRRSTGELIDIATMGRPELHQRSVGDLCRTVEAIEAAGLGSLPLGFVGFSMGTLTGVGFLAEGPPVKAAVLAIGGSTLVVAEDVFPEWLSAGREELRAADPASHAPRVTEPKVLMMNADRDEIFNRRAAFALYDALGSWKRLLFFPGTHAEWMEPAELGRTMLWFLRTHLPGGRQPAVS